MTMIPPSSAFAQQESVQFNQPVSEASASAIGALANYLRQIILPVGSVVYSVLDEAAFQFQNGGPSPAVWILADGRNVAGSAYQGLTGSSTIPDLRGVFVRGRNYSRSTGTGDAAGDLSIGTYEGDTFGSHNHAGGDHAHIARANNSGPGVETRLLSVGPGGAVNAGGSSVAIDNNINSGIQNSGPIIATEGSPETRPRSVILNAFIRIN